MSIKSGTYYNERELRTILDVDRESKQRIYMPNELFKDLVNSEDFKARKANATHIAFAFSYLYLASYMYRYARFTYYEDYFGESFIDDSVIYKICNISPDSRGAAGVSYITKKDGVLNKLNYIRKESDYPIRYKYEEDISGNKNYSEVYWKMLSDIKDELPSDVKLSRARKINFPVRAIYFDEESENKGIENGYFFITANTTEIDINTFIFCMKHSDIGVVGFYLYSFLKCMNGYFRGEYNSSIEQLVIDTGIKSTKLSEVIKTLEAHNMITNTHNTYVPFLPQDKHIPANGYRTLERNQFTDLRKDVAVRKVMSQATYEKKGGKYLCDSSSIEEDDDDQLNDIPLLNSTFFGTNLQESI
ncbi:hypothetical protein [Paenibacillus sp. AR247]|uniref:hypothetical protein n=1 Tax=Paenibacillus sp. AR247 TaxID=1631599 RepID=UPI000CF983E9|nr:hypothetical protein [Paenibacillus sp. AR247]PQP90945.1 hypothetical protein CPT76_03775 [Paenibacillus sp. AR247]